MKILLKILDFLNLLEYTGDRLSITNIALIVLVAKLAISHSTDWPSLVAVITSFANYSHKRYMNAQSGSIDQNPSNPPT